MKKLPPAGFPPANYMNYSYDEQKTNGQLQPEAFPLPFGRPNSACCIHVSVVLIHV